MTKKPMKDAPMQPWVVVMKDGTRKRTLAVTADAARDKAEAKGLRVAYVEKGEPLDELE